MTDKVQKIREEVEMLKLCTMDEHMKFYSDAAEAEYNALCNIEHFIDSLQEDHNTSDWLQELESMSNEQVKERLEKVNAWYNEQFTNEEPVSENLLKASMEFAKHFGEWHYAMPCFQAGAEWQKSNLWKPADGDDLPEYEREVVVFTQDFPNDAGMMRIAIAHRPDPKGFDGKSVTTGKVEHYTPKTYDKGGWNIPNVKYWLDYNIDELLCEKNETDN